MVVGRPLDVVQVVVEADVAGWGKVKAEDVHVEQTVETEWHHVFFLGVSYFSGMTPLEHTRLVVNIPSWRGATLTNKSLAAQHVAGLGLGPCVLGNFEREFPPGSGSWHHVHVSKWLSGGNLQPHDLENVGVIAELGTLYGRLHADTNGGWFDRSVKDLREEGALLENDDGTWASCTWVLPWLQRLIPEANASALAASGVNWGFIASEITGLRESILLPPTATVTVHGDSHLGNLMRDDVGNIMLIDFDMTAVGPAGSEFGFLVLMVFRCGFTPEGILSREFQRVFAAAYLACVGHPDADTHVVDELLFTMHLWGYVGMLKMGLLCAILMENENHAEKRAVMKARAPVLLHEGFLRQAKSCMQRSKEDSTARCELLERGLFFVTEKAWRGAARAVE